MRILAEVIDLTKDHPRPTDHFLVDSNVWFRLVYGKAKQIERAYLNQKYFDYVEAAFEVQSVLYRSLLSFGELAHSIEVNEWRDHIDHYGVDLSFKDFRRDPVLHQQTVATIRQVWYAAELATGDAYLPALVDLEAVQTMDAQLDDLALDGYDLLMLHAMHAADLTQLLTDDAHFGQVPAIQVFTANPYLIQQATQQGRLITRPTE